MPRSQTYVRFTPPPKRTLLHRYVKSADVLVRSLACQCIPSPMPPRVMFKECDRFGRRRACWSS